MKDKNKKFRVLHLPSNISGNAYGLSRAERQIGFESDVLRKYPTLYKFQYPIDIDLRLSDKGFLKRFITITKAFLKYRNKYDIFHFNLGSTFYGSSLNPTKVGFLDLPFYPKKAKLFVTFNGCDARQKLSVIKRTQISACREENCQNNCCYSATVDEHKAKSIKTLSKYVKHMWALNPDLLYFLPKEKSSFLPYSVCHFNQEVFFPEFNKKLKILHAPSNRATKGTKYILNAMDKLIKKYPDFIELQLIENLPHEEALAKYRQADLVIDQIMIGWIGAFAVEVMLMGKPLIARLEMNDLKFLPKAMTRDLIASVIDAGPNDIYDVLEKCIHDREFLKRRSRASLEYAKRWHDPLYIASLVKEKYESD